MSTAAPSKPTGARTVTLTAVDGTLTASWPRRKLRFLLDDGTTVDVVTEHDTSDLRAAVLRHTGAASIAGVVILPADTGHPTLFTEGAPAA